MGRRSTLKGKRKSLVLVADAGRARMFSCAGGGEPLIEIAAFANPEGVAPAAARSADEAGRTFDRAGQAQHAMDTRERESAEIAARFARELCDALAKAALVERPDRVVLVADPSLLGVLRKTVHGLGRTEVESLAKDLSRMSPDDIRGHIAELL